MNAPASQRLCTFKLGGLLLGIDVLLVQEVLRARQLTPVPRAPALVQGLLNLRGQIVPALDLRQRFGMPPRHDDPGMFMIVQVNADSLALVVDDVGDVIDVDASTFEPPPETISGPAATLIAGVYKLPAQLLHLLDATAAAAPTALS